MRRIILAAILMVVPIAAVAQNPGSAEMEQGLSMLEVGASNTLSNLGIEADVMTLTLGQLAEIKSIMEGSNTTSRKQRVEQVVAR